VRLRRGSRVRPGAGGFARVGDLRNEVLGLLSNYKSDARAHDRAAECRLIGNAARRSGAARIVGGHGASRKG
jgi:hypothetical protein